MTREQAKKIYPILKAYSEGKDIEWKHKGENENWKLLKKSEEVDLPSDIWEFRIKE